MANIRAAKRYAEALLVSAEEQKVLEQITEDVRILEQMMKESRDFLLFLKSPIVNKDKKLKIFKEILEQRIHGLTMSFLSLLTEKGREDILGEILLQFGVLRDEKLGIVNVEIKTASALSKGQLQEIEKRFEAMTRKKVRLAVGTDDYLKGGLLARVRDTVFDGSIKRQLELLRERFAQGVETVSPTKN